MDETPADLEPASSSSSSSGLTLVALAVAVLGLIVGGAGIYLAMQAAQSSQGIRDQVESEKGKAVESVSELESQLEAASRQINAIAENVEALKTKSRMDGNSNRRAFEEMGQAISENREQINQNTEDIAKIPEQVLVQTPQPVSAPAETADTDGSGESSSGEATIDGGETDASGNRIHVIEAGDTFAKLAAKYNVRLSAIQAANPTVDPRRLQIGDRIRIPGN